MQKDDTLFKHFSPETCILVDYTIKDTFHCCHCACCLYLAAAGETLVVVGSPAGAVSMVLVLKEAGVGVFLQLLWVLHKEVVKLGLLRLPPGPELTVVWHMDLQRGKAQGNEKRG